MRITVGRYPPAPPRAAGPGSTRPSGERELQRLFTGWIRRLARRLAPNATTLPPAVTLEDLKMTLEERVSEWPKQWRQEGLEQGIAQGREEGLEQQRALLRRLAAARFGDPTAERLAPALARIADPNRIAEIGDWLVRCDTGSEFLARIADTDSAGNIPRET